jgi:malate/lactate dehydrogenase
MVGKWCKEVDEDRMRRHLDQETELEAEEPELVLDQKEEHMSVSGTRTHETRPSAATPATDVITDSAWLETDFIKSVQQRGAAIIQARGAPNVLIGHTS